MDTSKWGDGTIIALGLGLIAAFFAAIIVFDAAISAHVCHVKWAEFGETRFGLMQGCMVHYKGRWTPADAIRETP